jgi:transglycosylase-like protein
MRRAGIVAMLVALPALAWLALASSIRALVTPRLAARLGAAVSIDHVRLAWPPGIALCGVRAKGAILSSAREIDAGIGGIVVRGAVLHFAGPATRTAARSATRIDTPAAPHDIRLEDSTVLASWTSASVEARGVWARPVPGGWRVTARRIRATRDGLVLQTGPAAADVTLKRSVHRVALSAVVVESQGIRIGPMLVRAADLWSPDGLRLEVTLPEGEARLSGERLSGWLAGHVEIRLPPAGAALVRADLAARDLIVRHPALARVPLGPAPLSLAAVLALESDRISVEKLSAKTGALALSARGTWDASGADVEVTIERADCAAAIQALPEGLAPVLTGMRLSGEIEAAAHLRFRWARIEEAKLDLDFPALCRVVADSPAAPMSRVGLGVPPLRSYGKRVPAAFQVAEDLRFFSHHGFDAEQIRKALLHDLENGGFLRGASTISQQVVKNLFLTQERTLSRKLQEAVLAWRMEQVVPKQRILEAYLALVELGPGLRGVHAAARAYFDRAARDLTPLQAMHLAALTPAPIALSRKLASGVTPEWRARLDELLDFMRHQRLISPADWLHARAEHLRIRQLPALARQ